MIYYALFLKDQYDFDSRLPTAYVHSSLYHDDGFSCHKLYGISEIFFCFHT